MKFNLMLDINIEKDSINNERGVMYLIGYKVD
jgi:hypothetical protein